MNLFRRFFFIMILSVLSLDAGFGQAENVAVSNPVYSFLKRMELKGIIEGYHDVVLPISRRQIADFLEEIAPKTDRLTEVEQGIYGDLQIEFSFELSSGGCFGGPEERTSILNHDGWSLGNHLEQMLSDKEKYLYWYADTNLTFFVDGLFTLDRRRTKGDALGSVNTTFAQFGGRVRGTIYDKIGYYIEATNAQFWGSRDLLYRDKKIRQAYTLGILNSQNFDFVEGYIRYDADIFSVQVGRERLLWGNGYGDKMIMSDNVRVFDFIRADAHYKSLSYTFMHGWLLGKKSLLTYTLPSDTLATFKEPVVADKYIAAHRIAFTFPSLFEIGFQEMEVYSNRSVDLAYLNPLTLLEAAQRSREERDNGFWTFDFETRCLNNVEFHGTFLFDDINFSKWGTSSWENRYAYQIGAMAVDPFCIPNITLAVEFTRVEPFTFSHGRSRDNDYGSFGDIMSHHIGPNSDSWFFRVDYLFTHKLKTSLQLELQREGNNIVDSLGNLVQNVGGDFLQPRRGADPEIIDFLGGDFVRTRVAQLLATYEIVNEVFIDARYQYQRRTSSFFNSTTVDHDFGVALRVDF